MQMDKVKVDEKKKEMMTKDSKVQTDFDEQNALHLSRSFWLAFNNINMYGDSHPQAVRAVESFHAQLAHQMLQHKRILFHIERDGFFCGTWRMDRELRILRLIERLTSSGIESITFEPSLTVRGLGIFLTVLIDAKDFRTAKEIEGALSAAEAQGIRINRHKYARTQVITDVGAIPPSKPEDAEPEVRSANPDLQADYVQNSDPEGEKDFEPLNAEIDLKLGNLDLGEVTENVVTRTAAETTIQTWSDLTGRIQSEIVQFKGGAESSARFDRFYESLESLMLRFLLASTPPDDESGELDHLTARMEEFDWKLLSELDAPLRDHQLFEGIGSRLKDRFVHRVAMLWADTVWQKFQPMDEPKLPGLFSRVESDLKKSKNPQLLVQSLLYLLDDRGLPDNLFALIWERLVRKGGSDKVKAEALIRLKMPKEIESRKEIIRDIETEMYRYNRYKSPFSCLSISLLGVRSEPHGAIRNYNDEELNALFTFLASELQVSLRKLDRVGTVGSMRQNYILILLPMTDVTGAVVLLERLENRAENWKIVSCDGFFYPVLLFSSFTYNADKVKDVNSLLRKIRAKQRKKGQYMTKTVLKIPNYQN